MMTHKKILGFVLGLLLPLLPLLVPSDLEGAARAALALSVFAVVFWTLEPVPMEYTALLVLLLFPLLRIVPFEAAFGAFSGKAVWLVFSGMALSLGITETPLGNRIARVALGRAKSLGRLLLGLHLLGLTMALLIPSAGVRVLILMPVLVSLLKAMGERPGSPVSAAVVLSLVCSTYYGGTGVLTGTVPNVMVLGALETRKIPVYWGQWAFLMFPVLGILRVGCGYFLIRWLFREDRSHPGSIHSSSPLAGKGAEVRAAQTESGTADRESPFTSPERKVLGILLLGILLWATDALHGVHPVYVGLLLVVLCYMPGWGPIAPDRLRTLNFPLLIYIAALFTMGRALEITGVTSRMAGFMTGIVDLSGSGALTRLGAIPWMVAPFDFLMDTAVVAGMLTPVLLDFGASLGLGPVPTALSVALGTGLVFIPYQSAPFVVAYSYRQVRMSQFILAMTLISLLTLLLLLPLHLLFWRLIGFV